MLSVRAESRTKPSQEPSEVKNQSELRTEQVPILGQDTPNTKTQNSELRTQNSELRTQNSKLTLT